MNKMKIAWLFPDTLYLHGERGNILALERFAKIAGMEAETDKIDFRTEGFDPMNYDIIFCPPGEMVSFPAVVEWLKPHQAKLTEFIAAGRALIATGTSVALWCEKVQRADGSSFEGLGVIKADASENEVVYGDDNDFTCTYNDVEMEIIGNQIQMADFANKGEKPFGTLIYGYGNNGKDREEGFMKNNSVFTNSLGPVLVTNPKLTMEIIRVTAANKGIQLKDFTYDTELEDKSFATKKNFIMTKESRLTNCK